VLIDSKGPDSKRLLANLSRWRTPTTSALSVLAVYKPVWEGLHDPGAPIVPVDRLLQGLHVNERLRVLPMGHLGRSAVSSSGPSSLNAPKAEFSGALPPKPVRSDQSSR